jgi:4-carboxymuconolactone decarboxylase
MKPLLTGMALLALTSVTTAQDITVSRAGSRPPQQGPAENFTGNVRVERLFAATGPSRATGGLVTFEAGARTAWHTHPLDQTLIVTAGIGRVQHWGGPIQEIRKGDTVRISRPRRAPAPRGRSSLSATLRRNSLS